MFYTLKISIYCSEVSSNRNPLSEIRPADWSPLGGNKKEKTRTFLDKRKPISECQVTLTVGDR